MDLKSVLSRYDTKSKNTSDLTPHYVSREANKKLIEKLEARNKEHIKKNQYHYKSMLDQLKGNKTASMLDNPKAHAQNQDQSLSNQKMELIRMAKITANEARANMGTYEQTREQFITNYSPKINEFRMLPQIQGIFQQFSDPSYSEKGYDKNYLGQGASDKYLESILAGRQSTILNQNLEQLRASQSTTTGAVRALVDPLNTLTSHIARNMSADRQLQIEDMQHEAEDAPSREEKRQMQVAEAARRVAERIRSGQVAPPTDDAGRIALQLEEESNVNDADVLATTTREQELEAMTEPEFLAVLGSLPPKVGRITTFDHYVRNAQTSLLTGSPVVKRRIIDYAGTKGVRFIPIPARATAEQRTAIEAQNKPIERRMIIEEALRRYERR